MLLLTPVLHLSLFASELQSKVEDYKACILDLTHDKTAVAEEYQALVAKMDGMAPAPLPIQKKWVKNVGKMGGRMEWLPHVDKLILDARYR